MQESITKASEAGASLIQKEIQNLSKTGCKWTNESARNSSNRNKNVWVFLLEGDW